VDTRRRLGWTGLSVACTGLTNLGLPLAAQLIGGFEQLGTLTLVLGVFTISLALQRAVAGQWLLVDRDRAAVRRSTAVWGVLSVASSALAVLIATLLGDVWLGAAAVVVIPFALGQDVLRSLAMGAHQNRTAALSDLAWLVAFGAAATPIVLADAGIAELVLAWGSGAVLGLVLLLPVLRHAAVRQGRSSHRVASRPLLIESAVVLGFGYALVYGLALVTDVSMLGEFRLAQTLASPAAVVVSALTLTHLPQVTDATADAVLRLGLTTGRAVAGLSAGYLVLLLASAHWWTAWLGATDTASILTTVAVLLAAGTISARNTILLAWCRRRLDRWLVRRVVSAAVEPVAGLGLAWPLGAVGAACGLLAQSVCLLALTPARVLRNVSTTVAVPDQRQPATERGT
jgi:hypothetical protein